MPVWPYNQLELSCYPPLPEHVSLPWDSGDEYLLQLKGDGNAVVFNDRHGAITCALGPLATSVLDSACAQHPLQRNWPHSDRPHITWLESGDTQSDNTQALIKFPKSFDALLRYLQWCWQHLGPDAAIHLAGPVKHIPIAWLNWLEQHCASYQQHKVQRKARAVSVQLAPSTCQELSHWQGYTSADGLNLQALPLVFSRQREDRGGRALLNHLAEQPNQSGHWLDLGCGNGLLGLTLKQRWPDSDFTLTDDSLSAVLSAQANAQRLGLTVDCQHGDSCENTPGPYAGIVCNPPFHDGHKQLTNLALRMFEQAKSVLADDGRLLVVANRHLAYRPMLNRLFRQVRAHGADKFTIYDCQP